MPHKIVWRACACVYVLTIQALLINFCSASASELSAISGLSATEAAKPASEQCLKVATAIQDSVVRSRLGGDSERFFPWQFVQRYSCLSGSVQIFVALPRQIGYFIADPIPMTIISKSNSAGELDAYLKPFDSTLEIYKSEITKSAWNQSEVRYSQLNFVLQSFSAHSNQSSALFVGYTTGGASHVFSLSAIGFSQSPLSKPGETFLLSGLPAHSVNDNPLLWLILIFGLSLMLIWPCKALAEWKRPLPSLARRLNRWLEIASVRRLTEKEASIFTSLLCRILVLPSLDLFSLRQRLKNDPEIFSGAQSVLERCLRITNFSYQPDAESVAVLQRDLEVLLMRMKRDS